MTLHWVRQRKAKRKRHEAAMKGAATRKRNRDHEDALWSVAMDDLRARKNAHRATLGLPPLPGRPHGFGAYDQQGVRR